MTDSLTYNFPVPEHLFQTFSDTLPEVSAGRWTMVANGFTGEMHETERVFNVFFSDWNMVVFVVIAFLFVINRQLFPSRLRQMLTTVFSSRYNQIGREWNFDRTVTGLSVYVSAVMSGALFVQKFMFFKTGYMAEYNTFGFYQRVCVYIALFILFKHVIINLVGWLFKTEDATRRYSNLHVSMLALTTVILLPITFAALFNPHMAFFIVGASIWLIAWILYLHKSFVETIVFSKIPSIYVFLYFCTLEIMPYLVAVWMVVGMVRTPIKL